MQTALFCNACGAQLTEPLIMRSGKDPSVTQPRIEPEMPLAGRGQVFKSWEPLVHSYGDTREPLDFAPQYWVHPDDLTDRVADTKKRKRLSGCCGFAGLDGPNQVCRCGAEIGTLQNDCCTPHVFIAEPGTTSWERFPDGLREVMP